MKKYLHNLHNLHVEGNQVCLFLTERSSSSNSNSSSNSSSSKSKLNISQSRSPIWLLRAFMDISLYSRNLI